MDMHTESNIQEHEAVDHHGHHEDHYEPFIFKYLFSQDHKMIAKQYLITGIIWGVIAGIMSVLFRLQLAYPDKSFPFLETLFGKWAEGGQISPDFYYQLVTLHGTILVFFVLTAGLSGTFSNLLIPLQIGARDMASPFMNMLSYWFFFLAGAVLLLSMFLPSGAASGGWTAYPPLNALPFASKGSEAGVDYWIISIALFIISVLLGGLNYITTVINMRTKGMYFTRMPLTVWGFLFTAIIGLLSFPVLLAAGILMIFDRNFGTSFFLSDIISSAGDVMPNAGGNPILFQHLFWFLGHPEVYIIILPAMGMVSHILSDNSRKPIFGYMAMIYSILAITIIGFLVWAHHMFVTGMNPNLGLVFTIFTLLIAVPSAIKVFNWITTIWRGNLRLNPAMLFALGFVSLFISGGLTGIYLGTNFLDIPLHDTYFVVAHFHVVMGVAAMFGTFAGVYYWFPKMYARMLNTNMGYIHFFLTFIGAYLIFIPMHWIGLAGVPRRYYSFEAFDFASRFDNLNVVMTLGAIMSVAAQFIFIYNFFYSIWNGKKQTEKNPWKANSLEWTASIEPIHGNWPGAIPHVYRGAYDYAKDGYEYMPQTVPVGEEEQFAKEHLN